MKNTPLSKILIIFSALILSACGGGSSSSSSSSTPAPTYGAIAVNIYTQGSGYVGYGGSYIVSGRTSQASADGDALSGCKTIATTTNCSVTLEFGANTCGSIARSVTVNSGVYGTGTGSSGAVAEAAALSACVKNGGTNCIIPTGTVGTISGSKLTLCNGTASLTGVSSTEVNSAEVTEQSDGERIDYNNPK